ncbi:MAG: histidine-type phosphatase [Clostridium sp.]|nr:histidine-type phosphatase [Prevotella sp.]MCM1429446.1 histidine-type phosphatase [Clostridium sp.]
MFRHKIIIGAAAVMAAAAAFAQTTKEEVLSDLNRTGGVYYAYPVSESANTPTPKGYEPFYISHYGRHGSRYLISDRDYEWVSNLMNEAREAGALTPLGLEVASRLDSIMPEARGRGGDLSPLGVRQQKGIARRMYKAYPEVFRGSPDMSARSTLVVRCVLSMDAFCEGLKEENPKLNIVRESSNRYMPYLCYHSPDHREYTTDGNRWKEQYRKFKEKHTNSQRLIESLFNDRDFVEKKVNPDELMWGLYWIASDMQNMETKVNFYDIFTPDELFDLWQSFNYVFYVNDGAFAGNGTKVTDNALPLIENIIESADKAIAAGKPTATFRFGHDGNLIPLAAALELKDCDIAIEKPEEFYRAFSDWKVAPMAGNLQLIFFRNKKHPDDILVKFMLNERETAIPIETSTYPYYSWDKVREYYKRKLGK